VANNGSELNKEALLREFEQSVVLISCMFGLILCLENTIKPKHSTNKIGDITLVSSAFFSSTSTELVSATVLLISSNYIRDIIQLESLFQDVIKGFAIHNNKAW
jgi:hypothetical protein